jgi:dihydrofolate reductase
MTAWAPAAVQARARKEFTMAKVVAVEHLSLDGVYQAPARADEDTRDGFKYGAWSKAGDDPEMQQIVARHMKAGWSLLAGTTTYEDLYEGWHVRQPSHPMTLALSRTHKFVASREPGYVLRWENSTLLAGDATETVADLKKKHEKTLVMFGSGVLVRSLMQRALVDELVLMIHPVVLGQGRRFFDGEMPFTRLELADEVTTASGVMVATYQLASH